MRAAVYTRYGPPDVLQIQDVPRPAPKDNEVLVGIRAAAINPLDGHLMTGKPYVVRFMTGLPGPRVATPGRDLAGRVEAVGRDVTRFKAGDEVFGVSRGGTCAEYACASEAKLALKPSHLTFEQAAAVPVAGVTALQGLRDKGRTRPGQKVLINGAAGGVGTFAVQIAKSFGAEVTGVCSTRSVDLVRSIGADHVIDYTQEDFTQGGRQYDVLFDAVGNHSFSACRRAMNPGGIHVIVGGEPGHVLEALVVSWFARQRVVPFLAVITRQDLDALRELMEARKVTPVIDRSYPLSETAAAIRYLDEGHARGKVVVALGGEAVT